jgi:hypothetical protein
MPRFLWKIIVLSRRVTSRIIWFLVKPFLKKPLDSMWDKLKDCDMDRFTAEMAEMKYNWDPAYGVIDYTLYDLNYFLDNHNEDKLLFGKDCDDFAYAWQQYLSRRDWVEEVKMIACLDGWKIQTGHVFTVAKFKADGKWRLFNFMPYPAKFDTLELACQEFELKPLVSSGIYKNMTWCVA